MYQIYYITYVIVLEQIFECNFSTSLPLIHCFHVFQTYSLEGYKAKEQKISLLDEAIKSHDGNAITAVKVNVRFKTTMNS